MKNKLMKYMLEIINTIRNIKKKSEINIDEFTIDTHDYNLEDKELQRKTEEEIKELEYKTLILTGLTLKEATAPLEVISIKDKNNRYTKVNYKYKTDYKKIRHIENYIK